MHPERAIAYRKQVAALLQALVDEDLSPRAILNCWPLLGNEDPSVRCAYTMTWFFESDEDRHRQEAFYTDLQLATLLEVQRLLAQGSELPAQLISEYAMVIAPPEYHSGWTWREPWWALKQLVSEVKAILETNPKLRRARLAQPQKNERPQFYSGAFRLKF